MANILDELEYRGLIKDFSNHDEVRELLASPTTIYCGFDPSASSMHVGNYVMISLLIFFANLCFSVLIYNRICCFNHVVINYYLNFDLSV